MARPCPSQGAAKIRFIVADVLDFLGLPDLPVETHAAIFLNEAVSANGVVFAECLAQWLAKSGMEYHQAQFFNLYGRHFSRISGPPVRLPAEEVDKILGDVRPHVEWLSSELGIKFEENRLDFAQAGTERVPRKLIESIVEAVGNILVAGRHLQEDFSDQSLILVSLKPPVIRDVRQGALLDFEIVFSLAREINNLVVGIHVTDVYGRCAFGTNTAILNCQMRPASTGVHRLTYALTADFPEGYYLVGFAFNDESEIGLHELAWFNNLMSFNVRVERPVPTIGYVAPPSVCQYVQTSTEAVAGVADATGWMRAEMVPQEWCVHQVRELPVRIMNQTTQDWVSLYFNPINLSYRWIDASGNTVVADGIRSPLPDGLLAAGSCAELILRVMAPAQPGSYRLMATPVQESMCWFHERGFSPLWADVTVRRDFS